MLSANLKRNYVSTLMLGAAVFLFWCVPCEAQDIPADLKASLDSRLQQFIRAQREGRWDEVAEALGRYRRTSVPQLYTEQHKQCLITQMRSAPMIAFTIERVAFSSELHSLPDKEKWWYLDGRGTLRLPTGESSGKFTVIAYRDQQEWYFSPPNYDDWWQKTHVKDQDFSVDPNDELDIKTASDSPVELIDVHAYMDKESLSSRDLQFRVRNKSDKKILGYSLYLGREGGNITAGGPLRLEPGEISEVMHTTYHAYSYYCEERTKESFEIDEIDFADGSKWESPDYGHNRGLGENPGHKPATR